MLYQLLIYIFISVVCFWAGLIFYAITDNDSFDQSGYTKPTIFYLITGLIFITFFGQWTVLFFPAGFSSFLLILFLLISLSFFYKKTIYKKIKKAFAEIERIPLIAVFGLVSFLFMILVLNSGPTVMDDTDSYHIQMIKWIREYGTVPGIANLHLRFGFNSSWFISIGLLCPQISNVNTYLSLNGLLSLWVCWYFLEKFFIFFRDQNNSKEILFATIVVFAFCMIDWPMIRGSATNTNYDFITTCCVFILLVEVLNKRHPSVEWLIWPCYLFTVRMINYPLMLLSAFYLITLFRLGEKKLLFGCFIFSILMIAPFVVRNVILSGYPFFPVYQLDLFNVDWKADKNKLIEISEYIKYFNRVNPMFQEIGATSKLDFPGWIVPWYKNLFRHDSILVTVSLSCYLIILIWWKKIFLQLPSVVKFFLCIMIFQLVSWFVIAPDPRFAYGSFLASIFIFVYFLSTAKLRLSTFFIKSLFTVSLIAMVGYTVFKISNNSSYRNWIVPSQLPIPTVRKIIVDSIELNIPGKILGNWNPRCYDVALPCLYNLDPRLEPRGKSIKDGFRLANSPGPINGEYNFRP